MGLSETTVRKWWHRFRQGESLADRSNRPLHSQRAVAIERPSHRVTGDRRDRVRGIGWELAHVAIDDHSRTCLATMAEDERKESAVAFLEQVVEHFRACGIRVQRVTTDNGPAYRSRDFAGACSCAICIPALYAQTNGEAERFYPDGAA